MGEETLNDLLLSIAYFFVNPLLWLALIIAILLGYFRVKKERKSYRVRMLPGFTEFKRILSESWLHALILSILIAGIGLVVDTGWLILFVIVTTVFLLTFNFKLASPIYMATLSFSGLYALQYFASDFEFRGWQVGEIDFLGSFIVTIAMIAGLLLVAEGLLVNRHGARNASTYLIQTNRGLKAGVFKMKKLWMLPILFVVPGDMIGTYLPYWPQFTFGEHAFTFIPVPIMIGFSQIARSRFPEDLCQQMGRAIVFTGISVCAVGIAALWMPILGIAALLAGTTARMAISIAASIRERKEHFVLAPQSKGVVVAGILPDSPGEKLGLLPGESIRTVNGQAVHNEKELYDAIQINAAHCRLQIIDRNGEVRLMQQVVYHHDHHRLGILVVQ